MYSAVKRRKLRRPCGVGGMGLLLRREITLFDRRTMQGLEKADGKRPPGVLPRRSTSKAARRQHDASRGSAPRSMAVGDARNIRGATSGLSTTCRMSYSNQSSLLVRLR